MAFWDLFVSKNNKGLTSSLTADAKPSFRIKIPQKSHIISFNPAYSCLVSPKSQIPNLLAYFNNVRYIEWMLDSSPEILEGKKIQELELVFRSETMLGDVVTAKSVGQEENVRMHQIASAEGVTHVLARSKWM